MQFQLKTKQYFLLLLMMVSLSAFARKPINYQHKSITKTVAKTFDTKEFALDEMTDLEKEIPQGKFFTVKMDNKDSGFVYVGRVECCRAGGCNVPGLDPDNNGEYFDFVVVFDGYGVVENIKVYSYMATHGHEVTARGWLKQFYGYNGSQQLRIGKEIDAISGATISANSLTACVEYITNQIQSQFN